MIALKKKKVEQELYEKQQLTRDITTFILLHRFAKLVHNNKEALCERFRASAQISLYKNKFCRVLKQIYHKIKELLPSKRHRDLANVHSAIYLMTRIDKPQAEIRAANVFTKLIA